MRTDELERIAKRRKLDLVLVADQANIRALTGINCDNNGDRPLLNNGDRP